MEHYNTKRYSQLILDENYNERFIMKRESHLFASHKFLEALGGRILIGLAKVDFRNTAEVEALCKEILTPKEAVEIYGGYL